MRIKEIMLMWADWHRAGRSRLGYPSRAAVIATGGVNCWDDIAEGVDTWICSETETAVNDLEPIQACAIHHCYLHSVYRWPRGNYPEVLGVALDMVAERLKSLNVLVEDVA